MTAGTPIGHPRNKQERPETIDLLRSDRETEYTIAREHQHPTAATALVFQ